MTLNDIAKRIEQLAATHRTLINEAVKIEGGMAELGRMKALMEAEAAAAVEVQAPPPPPPPPDDAEEAE